MLRGSGRFIDDGLDGTEAFACFVRSPHASARIRALDVAAARQAPHVLAVITAADITAAGVGNVARPLPVSGRGGVPMWVPHRPALADSRVLHVGQPVVLIVAETSLAAQDAAERVVVDYEALPAVSDVRAALAPDAPELWPEAPGNVAVDWAGPVPDSEAKMRAVEKVLSEAQMVARVSLINQRVVVASMEPRGATARYDRATDRYRLHCGSQGVSVMHAQIAGVMGLPPERLRVTTGDVGGAFGMKTAAYPEYPALLVAARLTGRAVHWASTRSEAFLSDNQGRDTVIEAALALDGDGNFMALSVRAVAAMGAFLTMHGATIATNNFARCWPTVYRVPQVAVAVQCVYTHTVPTGPYRGAGRPEANYAMERLVDEAARVSGIDRVALRRRNMITTAMLPYAAPLGTVYDSGDLVAVLDKALALADYSGFASRRAQSLMSGQRRGIGVSCFLEHSGGASKEGAALAFGEDNTVFVDLGIHQAGQGHRTVFGRLVAERLGLAASRVVVRQGDTHLGVVSFGSTASRSTLMVGSALVRTIAAVLEKGRKHAASLLEAAEADIGYRAGIFEIAGSDRGMSLFEIADRARAAGEPLDTHLVSETPQTFPNGCHIAEVEVDPETGTVAVVRYSAVDDCGVVLDHTIVEGQVHGGVAQGLGQALFEHAVYDAGSGQLLTGSFMDYAMPRAAQMPVVRSVLHEVPATTNPLGVKGVGEAGTTASLAAIMNAIADALPSGAGATLDMPATPYRVWQACRDAQEALRDAHGM